MALWIDRAAAFFRRLEAEIGEKVAYANCAFSPPLDRRVLDKHLEESQVKIPAGLFDFYTRQAAAVDMTWELTWAINECVECTGGIEFQNPIVPVEDGFHYCREWGVAQVYPGSVYCDQLLCSLVFSQLRNGDAIGFDCREGVVDPPVVFFSHEHEFPDQPLPQLASSFGEFLELWEQVCYLGPDLHVLSVCLDNTGRISPECAVARMLRSALRQDD